MQVLAASQSRPPAEMGVVLFGAISPPRRRFWLPLLGSLLIHCAILTLITWVGSLPVRDGFDLANYKIELLRLQVLAPLYYPEEARPEKFGVSQDRQHSVAKQAHSPAPQKTEVAANIKPPAPPAPHPALKPFELPSRPDKAHDGPIILQPDYLPQAPQLKTALPSMSFWSRIQPMARPIRRLVIPGRPDTAAPTAVPKLSAPPAVSLPNRELAAADINVSLPQLRMTPTPLPVSNSTTNPVRIREDKSEPSAAPVDPTVGQAVNLIAISNNHPPLAVVEIPKGLRNIPAFGESGGDGATSTSSATSQNWGGRTEQAPATSSVAMGATNRLGNPRGETAPVSGREDSWAGSQPGVSPKAASGENLRTERSGSEDSVSPRGDARGLAGPSASVAGNPGVTRLVHSPKGTFDVVLMQAGARDDLPDLGGILSGNPVYTVYPRVGEDREWLLEFCLPARPRTRSNPYEIDIDDVGGLSPPYPLSTVVPNSILGQQRPKAVVLHGYLSAAGNFRDIKLTNTQMPLGLELLPFLSQWQFRPALQNNKPVEVEVLLVVPPRT